MKTSSVVAAMLLAIAAFPAVAEEAAPSNPAVKVTPDLLASVVSLARNPQATYEYVLAGLTQLVRFGDLNGDGLSKEEIGTLKQAMAQERRAENIASVLRFDLNNDHKVTGEEFSVADRISRARGSGASQATVSLFEQADADHDGAVSLDELMALSPDQTKSVEQEAARLEALTVAVDPTPDTNFTLADARSVVDALFAAYDADKNGVIDSAEQRAARGKS